VENITHESITVYLSRLVEQVLRDLQATGCIEDAASDALVPPPHRPRGGGWGWRRMVWLLLSSLLLPTGVWGSWWWLWW